MCKNVFVFREKKTSCKHRNKQFEENLSPTTHNHNKQIYDIYKRKTFSFFFKGAFALQGLWDGLVSFLGMEIEVFWNDDDGEKWEKGKIILQTSDIKFIMRYDFFEESYDLEIFEKLFGPTAALWCAAQSETP